MNVAFVAVVDHVRNTLDTDTFDRCVATGAAMDTAEAVRYPRTQIEAVRSEPVGSSQTVTGRHELAPSGPHTSLTLKTTPTR